MACMINDSSYHNQSIAITTNQLWYQIWIELEIPQRLGIMLKITKCDKNGQTRTLPWKILVYQQQNMAIMHKQESSLFQSMKIMHRTS